MAHVLNKMVGETQLYDMLADERMRTESHRANYNKLKAIFMK